MADTRDAPIVASKNAIKRLMRDLRELGRDPVPGASLGPREDSDDMFELHANVTIPSGPYKGLVVHFIIHVNEYFPISSPAGNMAPDFPFGSREHGHIHRSSICNDYLSNFEGWFKSIDGGRRKASSGWSPGITLKNLLMVMGHFFADTDYPEPPADHVISIFDRVSKYKCPGCGHSTETPYPPISTITTHDATNSTQSSNRNRDLLVCSTSKENYVDSPDMVLGYPIDLRRDTRDRLWTKLIPELMCYDQYALQIQEKGVEKLNRFGDVKLCTANGQSFSHWLPVYINEDHYSKNLQCIKNTISVISNGIRGISSNDFQPDMILRVLPCLMNKMVVAMMKGDMFESESAIYAYCHYMGLFLRLLQDFPELYDVIDFLIEKFCESQSERHKSKVPDIGEFIVLLSVSKKYNFYQKEVQQPLLIEYFARQVFWIQRNHPDGAAIFKADPNRRIAEIFKQSETSLRLLVFDLMAARFFIFDGVLEKLGGNYGLPPLQIVEEFQKMIRRIKDINNYKSFVEAVNFSQVISSPEILLSFLNHAVHMSDTQAYTTCGGQQRGRGRGRGQGRGRGRGQGRGHGH